jgi:hypothetical protein
MPGKELLGSKGASPPTRAYAAIHRSLPPIGLSLPLHLGEPSPEKRVFQFPNGAGSAEILTQEMTFFQHFQRALHRRAR